jgi:hypothetical protein
MGQGSARVFNFISLFFLLLAVIVVLFVVFRMSGPALARPTPVVELATLALLPTVTPTDTATNTLVPTWTETFTPTGSATNTDMPTLTPSRTPPPSATLTQTLPPSSTPPPEPSLTITSTFVPSPTPVVTDTLAATAASNFTAQPTEPPPSPFPFELMNDQVIYTTNMANTAGCAWQGIGGQVFDLNDQPLAQIRVHVFGSGVDTYAVSGSNTLYGISGWEIPVSNAVNGNSYLVELQTSQGTIVSPQVQVTFPNTCSGNLARIDFKQTRPF